MKPLDGCGYPLGAIRRLARPDPTAGTASPDVIHHSEPTRSQAAWHETPELPALISCLRPLHLAEQRFRHLHVLRHADPAVHGDGLRQQLAGLDAVAGGVAVEEHAGVPAAHLRLLYLVRQLVSETQGGLVVPPRLLPLLAAGRSDAGHCL